MLEIMATPRLSPHGTARWGDTLPPLTFLFLSVNYEEGQIGMHSYLGWFPVELHFVLASCPLHHNSCAGGGIACWLGLLAWVVLDMSSWSHVSIWWCRNLEENGIGKLHTCCNYQPISCQLYLGHKMLIQVELSALKQGMSNWKYLLAVD